MRVIELRRPHLFKTRERYAPAGSPRARAVGRIIRELGEAEILPGQTSEQLLEALGRPADSEEEVMKTKTKHVLKYQPTGPNRYALRVMLEDGVVVGWHRS